MEQLSAESFLPLTGNSNVTSSVTKSKADIFSKHLTDMKQSTVNIGRI